MSKYWGGSGLTDPGPDGLEAEVTAAVEVAQGEVEAAFPVDDALGLVHDTTDPTKIVRIDAGTVATETTRVLTMANQDVSLVPNTGTYPAAAHATRHQHGGADEVGTATPAANAIPKAGAGNTLADGWIAESNVTQHEAAIDHDVLTNFVAEEHVPFLAGTAAARPAAATAGRYYFATDTVVLSRDNGTTWDELGATETAVLAALALSGAIKDMGGGNIQNAGTVEATALVVATGAVQIDIDGIVMLAGKFLDTPGAGAMSIGPTNATELNIGRVGGTIGFFATAAAAQQADISALTDNTGETPDDIIADVSTVVTGVDGAGSNAASKADVDTRLNAINENFSDLAQQVNALRTLLRTYGLMA